jgi:hypothetical protein
MKPALLFVITGDPRISARPAEAVRIAAGVGTWKKAEITIYLRAAAVLALSEFPDELIDEDNFTRYLPIVAEWGRPVYVQHGAPLLGEIGEARLAFEEIDDARLGALAAASQFVLRF